MPIINIPVVSIPVTSIPVVGMIRIGTDVLVVGMCISINDVNIHDVGIHVITPHNIECKVLGPINIWIGYQLARGGCIILWEMSCSAGAYGVQEVQLGSKNICCLIRFTGMRWIVTMKLSLEFDGVGLGQVCCVENAAK